MVQHQAIIAKKLLVQVLPVQCKGVGRHLAADSLHAKQHEIASFRISSSKIAKF